ncbi:hypothetical protein [Streptacidiphilus carbonis]|uniref:hypothetical protein n=1 Tax=Streptacidiphilus carbonis TaxID=105422 RepID=UPI0005A72E38|nr:hypothetical protein [Streptacidiphilus carbonis]
MADARSALAGALGTADAVLHRGSDDRSAFQVDLDEIGRMPPGTVEARKLVYRTGTVRTHFAWEDARGHVEALAALLTRQPPAFSPVTLTRAVLEAAALAFHLQDGSEPLTVRLARAAGLWATETAYELDLTTAVSPQDATGALARRQEMVQTFEQAGISMLEDRRGHPLALRLERTTLDETGVDLPRTIGRLLPANASLGVYTVLSGAAHTRTWAAAVAASSDAAGPGGTPGGGPGGGWGRLESQPSTTVQAVITTLVTLEYWVRTWGAFAGLATAADADQIAGCTGRFALQLRDRHLTG